MKKEKIKQYFLIFVAVFLIGVGYLSYNGESSLNIVEVSTRNTVNDITLGDVELVSTNAIVENDSILESSNDNNLISENFATSSISSINNETNVETEEDDYFAKTKLERDNMYSQMLETYQKMLDNSEISAEQKSIAAQEITNITKIKNGIMISENLIKNKGFEEVVILVNNNVASVIVKSRNLENEQIAKIQNIISRELGIEATNINISNK